MIKQLLLLPIVIRALDQFKRIVYLEQSLISGFVPVRLANDLGRVREERRISSPSAIPGVLVK